MKKAIINRLFLLPVFAAAICLAGCSDWTDTESLDLIEEGQIREDDPDYQAYLENLREYKKSDHTLLVGWFDNSNKAFPSQGDHIKSVPDSVDIISLLYPDNLTEMELQEMDYVRSVKGTKVIYTIDYEAKAAALNSAYDMAEEDGEIFDRDELFMEEIISFMNEQTTFLSKYGYDGATLYYNGVYTDTEFYDDDQVAYIKEVQGVVFDKFTAMAQGNPDKIFMFEGKPENVFNEDYPDTNRFGIFDYIVMRLLTSTILSDADVAVNTSIIPIDGVPKDKLIVAGIPYSRDMDELTGVYWGPEKQALSMIVELAYWQPAYSDVKKVGLGIYRINDDYYRPDLDYRYVRQAINVMNPSPKK